jgi:hypothetical protein
VCDKSAADQAKRQPATDAQRAEAQSVMNDIDRVVRRVGRCLSSDGNPCAGPAAKRPATDVDAEAAGQALSNAGLRSTVREERAAALRAALEGQRPNDEHLALLDRVLRALRRL